MPKSVIHLCIIHPLVLCKIDFFQNTSEAHPKLKETKVHKVISVILLSCFFLAKANLPPGDIYQCLKKFLIVTTRGMLRSLMSSSHALLNVLQTHSTVPTTETSLPKQRQGPAEKPCLKEQYGDLCRCWGM